MATYTPWGQAQCVKNFMRGVRMVSTAGHGGVMVSKRLAEKCMPRNALKRAIFYGGCYCFEEDLDWRWPAICICGALASIPYEELVKTTARVAIEYNMKDVYIACCARAGVGKPVAEGNMREYVRTEVVENVRRNILKYAADCNRGEKPGWTKAVHECIIGIAERFNGAGVTEKSVGEDIFRVGVELVNSGAVDAVRNRIFLAYKYDVPDSLLPVVKLTAA